MPPLFNDYWKFGFGYPLTIAAIVFLPRYFGYWASLIAFGVMGALHAAMDFRSMAAICLAVGALNGLFLLPQVRRRALVAVLGILILASRFTRKSWSGFRRASCSAASSFSPTPS